MFSGSHDDHRGWWRWFVGVFLYFPPSAAGARLNTATSVSPLHSYLASASTCSRVFIWMRRRAAFGAFRDSEENSGDANVERERDDGLRSGWKGKAERRTKAKRSGAIQFFQVSSEIHFLLSKRDQKNGFWNLNAMIIGSDMLLKYYLMQQQAVLISNKHLFFFPPPTVCLWSSLSAVRSSACVCAGSHQNSWTSASSWTRGQ